MSAQSTQHENPGGTETNDDSQISDDDLYSLLSSGRRRAILDELQSDEPLSHGELADRLTEREGEDPTGQPRKRVYISLYQQHLPKLVDHNVLCGDEDGYYLGPNAPALLEKMNHNPREGVRGRLGDSPLVNIFVSE